MKYRCHHLLKGYTSVGILHRSAKAADAVRSRYSDGRIPMPAIGREVGLCLGLQRGTTAPSVFSEKGFQLDLGESIGQQKPTMVCHDIDLCPARLHESDYAAHKIANFAVYAAC